jgi:hypothetical protein
MIMDIKEFIFRHINDEPTDTGTALRRDAMKDPEAVELCADFLYHEIYLEGKEETIDDQSEYDAIRWECAATEFIEDIIPSDTFMLDALTFFSDIREGKI